MRKEGPSARDLRIILMFKENMDIMASSATGPNKSQFIIESHHMPLMLQNHGLLWCALRVEFRYSFIPKISGDS